MALTAWRSTDSSGRIADLPAAGFRYRYNMEFVVYLDDAPGAYAALAWSAVGAGMPTPGLHTLRLPSKWSVRILDPNDRTIFAQTVELEFWFVALLTSMFGGVAFNLFTWWLNDGATKITTTVCNGVEIAEGERPPTLTGAEVGYADPAGGADYSTNHALFLTEWVSPIYYCSLPAGSRFKIDFHNVGLSKLRYSLSAIQTQVMGAGGAFRRLPGFGAVVGARAAGGGMEAHAWHAPLGAPPQLEWGEPLWTSEVGSVGGKAVWVPYLGGGRVALLWEGFGALLYAESDNLADVEGWEGPTTVLPGHTLLGADRDSDGVLYILARNQQGQVVGYRASRSLQRDTLLRLSEPTPCLLADGAPLTLTGVDMFQVEGGVCHVVVDRGNALSYYQGHNGMALWREGTEND